MNLRSVKGTLPHSVGEVAIVIVVFVFGMLVGARAKPDASDLWSFAGGLVGAAITVAGSVYVLEWQKGRADRERKELLLSLLDDVDSACRYFHLANELALLERHKKTATQVVNELEAAVARVRRFGEAMTPATARMMKVADEAAKLRVDIGMRQAANAAGLYREGDFGGLNAEGHEITNKTALIRDLIGT